LQIIATASTLRVSSMNGIPTLEVQPANNTGWIIRVKLLQGGTIDGITLSSGAGTFPAPDSTQPNRRNMNSQNNREVIVSGIHLELTPSLKTFVHEKSERLFRHAERIIRIRVELEYDRRQEVGTLFKAKGHVMIQGPDLNAVVEADECHKAISLLVDKLDRMLARRHQLHRVKRNHPHAVELTDALPKAV
jgi:putative sigma-54 modulation protein